MKKFIGIFLLILSGAFSILAQEESKIFYQALDFSPDGKYLSFTAMRDYDEKTDSYRTEIFITRANGSDRQKISGAARHAFSSAWSKNGGRIVFSAEDENGHDSNIVTVKKDGSDLIRLTKDNGQNTAPQFSPDGQNIAFMSARNGEKYQIYVMRQDGSKAKKLTLDAAVSYCNPMWSPDGKKIVYYSDKGDKKDQIWIMNADGSDQTLLTGGTGHNIFPSFTPDGKRIIFSRRDDREADKSYVDASYLYVMNADGSNLKKLSEINSFFARFSPDGRKIAFIMGKFPANNIYIANADGSNIVKLTK